MSRVGGTTSLAGAATNIEDMGVDSEAEPQWQPRLPVKKKPRVKILQGNRPRPPPQ